VASRAFLSRSVEQKDEQAVNDRESDGKENDKVMLHPWPTNEPVVIYDSNKRGYIEGYYGEWAIVSLDPDDFFYSEDRKVYTTMMVVHTSNITSEKCV
jgi:hypothetical protein